MGHLMSKEQDLVCHNWHPDLVITCRGSDPSEVAAVTSAQTDLCFYQRRLDHSVDQKVCRSRHVCGLTSQSSNFDCSRLVVLRLDDLDHDYAHFSMVNEPSMMVVLERTGHHQLHPIQKSKRHVLD